VKGVTHTNHSSQKTRLDGLSQGVKIWTDFYFILSQCSMHAFDRQTDRILIARLHLHFMQHDKNHSILSSMKLPKRLGCLEEHRELLHWSSGQIPSWKWFQCFSSVK